MNQLISHFFTCTLQVQLNQKMIPDNIFYFITFKTNCKLTFTTQNWAVDEAKDVSSEPFTRGVFRKWFFSF